MTDHPLKNRANRSEEPADAPRADVSRGLKLSRRSLLAAGAGLAASACAPKESPTGTGAQAPSARPALDAIAQRIRQGRRVVGRVVDGPVTADELFVAAAQPYFPQPGDMYMTQKGAEKSFTLDVAYLDIDIAKRDGEIVTGKVRAYNQHVPGPTIRCQAGDRLNVQLRNNLPDEQFTYDYRGCQTLDGLNPAEAGLPHGFNFTNLHTHGLHVSPQSLCGNEVCPPPPTSEQPTLASDDVFVTVGPGGGSQSYCIVLPGFHAPGTHWYHAHKHGSTSIQVNNGLLGALIIEEQGEDRILGDEPHEDVIFIMQEIMEVDNGNDQLVYAQTRGDSSKFFINGVYQPRQRMQTGEIQRWRFINGTSRPRGLAKLRLVKLGSEPLIDTSDIALTAEHGRGLEQSDLSLASVESVNPELFERIKSFQKVAEENAQTMNVIAVDGISFYGKAPMPVTEWDFAPGNRVDFLVKIEEPGIYAIVKDVHDFPGTNPECQTLAYVEVTQGTRDMSMPAVIPGNPPCYLDPIYAVGAEKTVDFQAQNPGSWSQVCPDPTPWTCAGNELDCGGTRRGCDPPPPNAPLLPRIFAIDCQRFEGDVVEDKYTMELGSSEEWTLRNFSGGAHPFHIHVNPFQVVEIFDPNGNGGQGETQTFDPDEALWQDVVAIPLPNGSTPGHVKIRHRFLTYPGDFVIHCHFLNHEDLGMMKRVQITPTGSYPGNPPCAPVTTCVKE